jgi:hypothetical protein
MKATSYSQLNPYEFNGRYLTIYWNEEAHEPKEDETEPFWTYDFCYAETGDSYGALVSKIIRSQYTVDAEFAAINNGGEDYEAYQAFRAQAKALADGWVNR